MSPLHWRVRLFPLKPEHFSLLREQASQLAERLDLEITQIARTKVLHETLIYLGGKDADNASTFIHELQNCFPDLQVSFYEQAEASPSLSQPGRPHVT